MLSEIKIKGECVHPVNQQAREDHITCARKCFKVLGRWWEVGLTGSAERIMGFLGGCCF